MPTELAFLPFVESAFNPQAVSSAKAAGMWQFMPATWLNIMSFSLPSMAAVMPQSKKESRIWCQLLCCPMLQKSSL